VLGKNCTILANLLDKHKDTVPLEGLIEAMHVGKNELVSMDNDGFKDMKSKLYKYKVNTCCPELHFGGS